MTAATSSALIGLAAIAAFALSFGQARINARHGTDHAVHSFLIRQIRANGFRLFVRIPRLLNEAYTGALPLYLHAIMARLPLSILPVAEKALNPAANFLLVGLAGMVAFVLLDGPGSGPLLAVAAAALYAATPQFYHALSARNFGLSARSLGLIFLTLTFLFTHLVEQSPGQPAWWVALAISCYLVIAFSTFALQAMIIVGVIATVTGGHWAALAGAGAGAILFVCIHPAYGRGYLANTARFVHAYAQELAPVYILARRPSIWGDLVGDIWKGFGAGFKAGFRYAYENSLLIVVLLNPLSVFAALGAASGWDDVLSPFGRFACDIALAGILAMLATSLRRTRFLGEPERYVEATGVFAAIGGAALLFAHGWEMLAWLVLAAFAAMDILQVQASRILSRYLTAKPLDLEGAVRAIDTAPVPRVAANNEQITKLLLVNDWDFSYCIAVGHGYCGMRIGEAFEPFPFLRREALARIVETYRITACVLDRTRYENVFDIRPAALCDQRVLFESAGLRVLEFDWAEPLAKPA